MNPLPTQQKKFGDDFRVLLRQGDVVLIERSRPCPPEVDGCAECERCHEIQEERAAIHQHDGEATKDQAEELASHERCSDHRVRKHYEVCIVQKNSAREIAGVKIAASESLPGNEQWGVAGWTFSSHLDERTNLKKARLKFDDLAMDLFPDATVRSWGEDGVER